MSPGFFSLPHAGCMRAGRGVVEQEGGCYSALCCLPSVHATRLHGDDTHVTSATLRTLSSAPLPRPCVGIRTWCIGAAESGNTSTRALVTRRSPATALAGTRQQTPNYRHRGGVTRSTLLQHPYRIETRAPSRLPTRSSTAEAAARGGHAHPPASQKPRQWTAPPRRRQAHSPFRSECEGPAPETHFVWNRAARAPHWERRRTSL